MTNFVIVGARTDFWTMGYTIPPGEVAVIAASDMPAYGTPNHKQKGDFTVLRIGWQGVEFLKYERGIVGFEGGASSVPPIPSGGRPGDCAVLDSTAPSLKKSPGIIQEFDFGNWHLYLWVVDNIPPTTTGSSGIDKLLRVASEFVASRLDSRRI